jgi:hypothetical protein
LGQESITIEIRPAQATLLIGLGTDPPRPLEELGSGVAEVLVFALALASADRGLLLYEEPEIHLHPRVQDKLLREMEAACESGWQFLLTTHSEYILSNWQNPKIRCIEVTRDADESRLVAASDREMLRQAIRRLGAMPGILAAKTILWVEGPSDAIYLRFFLEQKRPDLIEHEHYAFAFFGGALLAHTRLSAMPSSEIVDLFAVHPNSYLVLDSDRSGRDEDLGKKYARDFSTTAIKDRIWVTAGREVENYLPDEVLSWAATGKHDPLTIAPSLDRDFAEFRKQVESCRNHAALDKSEHNVSDKAKAKFAAKAVGFMRRAKLPASQTLTRLDLDLQIDRLIAFIDDHCA